MFDLFNTDLTKFDNLSENANEEINGATLEGDNLIVEAFEREFNGDPLLESRSPYKNSLVRVTKKTKLDRVTSQASFVIARELDDPLYKQLAIVNKKRRMLKAKIDQKYKTKAKVRVRELMKNRGVDLGKEMPDKDPNSKSV